MAISQFQNSQPILQSSPVASEAAGRESLSDAFSRTGRAITQEVEEMHKDHSAAMLMDANAQMNTVMTDAKIGMMQSPGQADEISSNSQKLLDTIGETSVSSNDKGKLNYLINNSKNSLSLQSSEHKIRQARIEGVGNYWQAYNKNMSDLSQAIVQGDEKSIEILSNSILDNGKNAVMQQILPAQAYQNVTKTVMGLHARAEQIMSHMGNPSVNAVDAHVASNDIFSGHNYDVGELPSNHGTAMLANHHVEQLTNNDANNGIINNHTTPDLTATLLNQSPEKFRESMQLYDGARLAHGTLGSNPNYTDIANKIETLDHKPLLNTSEKAELQVYKNFMSELNTGDGFWSVMANTSLGNQAITDRQNQRAALQNSVSYELSPEAQAEQKELQSAEIDNTFIDRGYSIAEGSHMDPRVSKVVPPDIMAPVNAAFRQDGDPGQALAQTSRLKVRNRNLLALQMEDGKQREVMMAVGLGFDNDVSQKFMGDYIASNQEHQDYSSLQSEDREKDTTIRTQIANNVQDAIHYLSVDNPSRIGDLVNSGLNYVKYRARQAGDISISNLNKYVNDFSREIGRSYDTSTRYGSLINNSQTQMSKSDQDLLGQYVKDEAERTFIGKHPDDLNFQSGLSKVDFTVYVDPTNHVIAQDADGNSLFYSTLNDNLISAARHAHRSEFLSDREKGQMKEQMKENRLLHGIF